MPPRVKPVAASNKASPKTSPEAVETPKPAPAEKQVKIPEKFSEQVTFFDQLVFNKDYSAAYELMPKMLRTLEQMKQSFGDNIRACTPQAEKQATIFCAAVTRLFSDVDAKLTEKSFFAVLGQKRALSQAFEVGGYRGTDHIAAHIGTADENGSKTLTRQDILKLFLVLSINAMSKPYVDLLLRQPPEIAWPVCLAFLSEQIVYTANGKEARSRLLASSEFFKTAPSTLHNVRVIGPAYMGCSYDEADHKHDIKYAMNHSVRAWLEKHKVTDIDLAADRDKSKDRPTVVVVAELYDRHHAMHRCYGPSIASLKSKFRTILVTPSGKIDEELVDMFDEVDPTPFDFDAPATFINRIKSYAPDMVYFTSIGMRLVSIACSNVRMAPIQLFTPGHPATTRSDHIDYLLLMEGCFGPGSERFYSEKLILRKNQPYFTMRKDAEHIPPQIAEKPATVRIAVPAWTRKVTPGFLSACKAVQDAGEKIGKQVEFWFFPNGAGSLHQGFARRVSVMLNAKALPRADYNTYIRNLNTCDFFLSTYPFGATNSIVDAVIQGLPVVNLNGPEAHAKNDSDMLRTIDQPEWLSANNIQEYIEAAVRLIASDELRVRISKAILACDPAKHFLVDDDKKIDDFADILSHIYHKHETIEAGNHEVLTHQQLSELS